jgi:hypothetical protein
MARLHHDQTDQQRRGVIPHSHSHSDAEKCPPPLTRSERARIALASLTLVERKCRLRLIQIEAERRAILAQLGWAAP